MIVGVTMTAAAGSAFVVAQSEAMTEKDHDSLHFLHAPSVAVTLQTLCEDCHAGSSALQQYDAPTERGRYPAHSIDLNSKTHYAACQYDKTAPKKTRLQFCDKRRYFSWDIPREEFTELAIRRLP